MALRSMSFAERGRLLAVACRAAVRLDRSRRQAGLPPPAADPWPESTWEFLKQQAARSRRSTKSPDSDADVWIWKAGW
ncbi:MAG: hypothetical protein ACE5KM_18510 [Planctomycetaceae bacterium]